MTVDIIPVDQVEKSDKRNSKRRFLPTDGICLHCAAIINNVYENQCIICDCGNNNFITGNPSIQIRSLLNLEIYDLEALNELRGYSVSSRPRMIINILKSSYSLNSLNNRRINEELIRKIIIRNRKKFFYMKNIDDIITKTKKQIKLNKPINIRLIDIEDCI